MQKKKYEINEKFKLLYNFTNQESIYYQVLSI